MTKPQPAQKVVVVPVYWVGLAMIGVALMLVASAVISVAVANQNSRELIARYEADKQATAAANTQLYCALFGSQLDAFGEAQSPAGQKSYAAWLDLYRLAKCTPAR
jgi:hypothetical protein